MLLRRFSEHIKKQNWFAVFLDLFIVVLGVYLGFQVTAWNEQRGERALEAEYLQRIHDELRDAKVVLESIISDAKGNGLFAPDLSEYFDGHVVQPDYQRLAVAIYKFGLDPIDLRFDVSTYDDLVSTGRLRLISDPELRQAIQLAYADLQSYTPFRNPYRDEYKFAVSGWLPRSMTQRIRQACPQNSPYSECSGLDLDENTLRSIFEQIDRRQALLAFHNRDTGLGAVIGKGSSILKVLDETLALLERKSTSGQKQPFTD